MNLFIATPAYNCQLHTDYFNSMMSLIRGAAKSDDVDVEIVTIGNQSLVPKARNSLISYFHQNKQYDFIIFIDADIGIPAYCIPRLLQRGVDVIGTPCPLKGYDEQGLPVLNIGEILNCTPDGLAETTHVGNAILMLSRKAVNSMIEISEEYLDDPDFSRGQPLTTKCWDVFPIGLVDGKYLPEDFYLCSRLRKLGYKIYIDLTVPVRHSGTHGFATTEEHLNLLRQPKEENSWLEILKKEKEKNG